jgi:hypothetical protein
MKTIKRSIKISRTHRTMKMSLVLIIMKIKSQRLYQSRAISFNKEAKIKEEEKN